MISATGSTRTGTPASDQADHIQSGGTLMCDLHVTKASYRHRRLRQNAGSATKVITALWTAALFSQKNFRTVSNSIALCRIQVGPHRAGAGRCSPSDRERQTE